MTKEILLSFIAGIVVFISPCVLPLIPAYIFYITGLKAEEKIDNKLQFFIRILFFVLGFTIIFTALGIITALLTFMAGNIKYYLNILFGIILIIFSIHFLGFINIFFLNYEKRFVISKLPSSKIGILLVGMSFAAGWSPCVGPMLGSILALVSNEESIIKGIFLLIIFSLGLGIPLIITAMFFNYATPVLNYLKKHSNIIKIISGIFLFLVGILLLFNAINNLQIFMFNFAFYLEESMPYSNYIFSIILIIISILFLLLMIFNKKLPKSFMFFFIFFFILGLLNLFKILPLLDLFIKYITLSNG